MVTSTSNSAKSQWSIIMLRRDSDDGILTALNGEHEVTVMLKSIHNKGNLCLNSLASFLH